MCPCVFCRLLILRDHSPENVEIKKMLCTSTHKVYCAKLNLDTVVYTAVRRQNTLTLSLEMLRRATL